MTVKFDVYFSTVYEIQYKKTISAKSETDAEIKAKKMLKTLTADVVESWDSGADAPCCVGVKFDWVSEAD